MTGKADSKEYFIGLSLHKKTKTDTNLVMQGFGFQPTIVTGWCPFVSGSCLSVSPTKFGSGVGFLNINQSTNQSGFISDRKRPYFY